MALAEKTSSDHRCHGICGFTAFNSLFYIAAHETTAVNLGIIQGAMPMFVLFGAFVILRTPVRMLQLLGALVTMSGVAFIASQGTFPGSRSSR